MWGLPIQMQWRPWTGAIQPELALLHALRAEPDIAALIGSSEAGPRGRYGVVGLPKQVHLHQNSTQKLHELFNSPPPDCLRIIALSYESGFELVHLPESQPPRGQPAIVCFDLDAAVIVDHFTNQVGVFGQSGAHAQRLREQLELAGEDMPASGHATLVPAVSDKTHAERILRTQEHIRAGDIYQANIARRLRVDGDVDAVGLLVSLCSQNPVAHSAYLKTGELQVLSNTMETLLTYDPEDRLAQSFPIKGTRGRSSKHPSNLENAHLLSEHPKERAEHVMIVDLVRNDLGRVCIPGSVRVPKLMNIEGFRGVWHGISTVEGRLCQNQTLADLVAALFPGGSITGAPKRRSMELIQEIEEEPRGFYTGSIGLLTPQGRLSMSILIRTLIHDEDGWSVSVGGGIVSDSQAEREIVETWEKVAVFNQILGNKSDTGEEQAS